MAAPTKGLWRRFRARLKSDQRIRSMLARGLLLYLRFVYRTNRLAKGSSAATDVMGREPVIMTLWHGRQFLAPFFSPPGVPVSAIVSRSADAELNAAVLERLGVETIRGSGDGDTNARRAKRKNGVGAFKALVGALDRGRSVVMIADRRSAPRETVDGVVRLARASGRPIVPFAIETSRGITFSTAWDRARLNLPFGRVAVVTGAPVKVGRDDDLEECRREVTARLNAVTRKAVALCAGKRAAAKERSEHPVGEVSQ